MATEPAEFAKTPAEIYRLASRSEQVIEAAKLLEFALREYSGDYRLGFTELYNTNRKLFEKPLRDRIRLAFEVRNKIRNVAKHGEPEFEAKSKAADTFIDAAQVLFGSYRKIYPEKFWPATSLEPTSETHRDAGFFEQGFDSGPTPPPPPTSYDQVRSRAADKERAEIRQSDTNQTDQVSSLDEESLPKAIDAEDEFKLPSYDLAGPGGLFPPRIKVGQMEKICNRMGRSLKAGISITKVWESEARSFTGQVGDSFREVLDSISSGETLAASVSRHECFPQMFCEMVRVGEETGRLDQVFLRLADHYRNLVQMRRTFISGITWPVFQLTAVIGVISLFFVALAILESMLTTFVAPDIFMLGFGPMGNLAIFWTLLVIGGAMTFVAVKGVANGWFGTGPMRLALRIPLIGQTIRVLSLSRFAWSFGMAIESGMDAQRAIRLGIRSTDNHFYTVHEDDVAESVGQGNDFYTSLDRTDSFPEDFLQAVEVGELTGEITESLERLSDDYREQAEMLLRRISQVSGFLISIFVAIIIIFLIVLMYMNYIGTLNDAISNPMGALEQYESGATSEKSTNPVTAQKNQMVNQIMEMEDMKTITNMYEAIGNSGNLHGHDLLDALLEPFDKKK